MPDAPLPGLALPPPPAPRDPALSPDRLAAFWRLYALAAHGLDRLGLRRRVRARPPRLLRRPVEVERRLEALDEALWTAHSLAAAADCGLVARLREPCTLDELAGATGLPPAWVGALVDVMAGLGLVRVAGGQVIPAPGLAALVEARRGAGVGAAMNASLLQAADFLERTRGRALDLAGWTHTDPRVIEHQGTLTALMTEAALPKLAFLPGLLPALRRPGARLLDVGAGAAGLSITLCRHFPGLRAVALEPAPAPAEIGERNLALAGLSHRVELRRERAEALAEAEAYDLVFLPQMFLSDEALAGALPLIHRAMRPGAWLLVAAVSRDGADAGAAVSRLKGLLWGGTVRDDGEVAAGLRATGFDPVITPPGGGMIRTLCAQRPVRM